jgi:hypothetical protein
MSLSHELQEVLRKKPFANGCHSKAEIQKRHEKDPCNPAAVSSRYFRSRAAFDSSAGQTPAASATAAAASPALDLRRNPLSTPRGEPGILVDVHPVFRKG